MVRDPEKYRNKNIVIAGGAGVHQMQLLVDYANRHRLRMRCAVNLLHLSVHAHFSVVFAIDPGKDFHERGFARAVFAHQGMHLTGLQIKLHLVQRPHAREGFA